MCGGNRAVAFVPGSRVAGAQVPRKQGKTEMFMNCREYRNSLMEWARGVAPAPEVVSHLGECRRWPQFLEERTALSVAMAILMAQPLPTAEHFHARVISQ